MPGLDGPIEDAIFALLAQRGDGKTICPSEAARRVSPTDWRDLMDETRAVAGRLAAAGRLVVTQRGEPVELASARGPIRLSLPDT